MRRIQIHIDDELDSRLGAEAARAGTSKAALIRTYIAERLNPSSTADPLDALVGSTESEPAPVDDVVYGR